MTSDGFSGDVPAFVPTEMGLVKSEFGASNQDGERQGLGEVIDRVLNACEQQRVTPEWLLSQLVENRIVPPGIMQLIQQKITPLVADIQEELRVASRVVSLQPALRENAGQKLLAFLLKNDACSRSIRQLLDSIQVKLLMLRLLP